jgi:hypothetical protein
MLVLLDLTGVSSFGRFRWQSPLGDSCLEIARSEVIRSCVSIFFPTVWFGFRREQCEALQSVAIMECVFFYSMVK